MWICKKNYLCVKLPLLSNKYILSHMHIMLTILYADYKVNLTGIVTFLNNHLSLTINWQALDKNSCIVTV